MRTSVSLGIKYQLNIKLNLSNKNHRNHMNQKLNGMLHYFNTSVDSLLGRACLGPAQKLNGN